MSPIPNDWISEDELATQLNVDRDKIRAQRLHLDACEVMRHGQTVIWLRTAAARVATQLGLGAAFPEKSAPDDTEELAVASGPGADGYHFAQHHLIRARRSDGELVVVQVLDSSKYVPRMQNGQPMVLRAKKSHAGNWWLLVGREPRFVGRW
jgi:hypothetical protein